MAEVAWGWWALWVLAIFLPLLVFSSYYWRQDRSSAKQTAQEGSSTSPILSDLSQQTSQEGKRRMLFFRRLTPSSPNPTDEELADDIQFRLTHHPDIDTLDIDVEVINKEVYLRGFVENRFTKRLIEDLVDTVTGIRDIHNQLKIEEKRKVA